MLSAAMLTIRARVPQRPAFVSSTGNPDSFIVGATNLGSPFFAYFLWRSKESELPPGNPRHRYINHGVNSFQSLSIGSPPSRG